MPLSPLRRISITLAIFCALSAFTGCGNSSTQEQPAAAPPDSAAPAVDAVTEYDTTETTSSTGQNPDWIPSLFSSWNEETAMKARQECESHLFSLSKKNPDNRMHNTSAICRCVTDTMKKLAQGQLKKTGADNDFSQAFALCYVSKDQRPGAFRRASNSSGPDSPDDATQDAPKPFFDEKTKTWRNR